MIQGLAFVVMLMVAGPSLAQESPKEPTAQDVMQAIEANADYAFAEATANIAIAEARRDEARAALYPSLTLEATGQKFQSTQKGLSDSREIVGDLELVQPIYDFGKTSSAIDAAGIDLAAAGQNIIAARNTVLLEGLALFYDLHASELKMRAVYEDHSSAYVRWDRAKEYLALGRVSPVEVAEKLTRVERTRLVYYRERSRNIELRMRLEELSGLVFGDELFMPPPPPTKKPSDLDRETFAGKVIERNPHMLEAVKLAEAAGIRRGAIGSLPSLKAFGNIGHSSRDFRGRNEHAVGVRLSWPLFDGGINSAKRAQLAGQQSRILARIENLRRSLRVKSHLALLQRENSFQQVIAAKAMYDFTKKRLLRRQQLYSQERVADLGRAMIDNTAAEADLVRATGAYFTDLARIAVMLGDPPARGLEDNYLENVTGTEAMPDLQYTPKGGSGFGQDDANKVNRNTN